MKKKRALFVVLFLGIAFSVSVYPQQSPQIKPEHRYKERGDRNEGIIKPSKLRYGGKLRLVGAEIVNSETLPENSQTGRYNLHFYLNEDSKVNINVQNFRHNYKMHPVRRSYKQGSKKFTWPSDIPLHYGIRLKDLVPLAIIAGGHTEKIAPILLSDESPSILGMGYRFIFDSENTIARLEYNIFKKDNTARILVFTDSLKTLSGTFSLHWYGKDKEGRPFPSGLYALTLEAKFKKLLDAKPPSPLDAVYEFYHFAGTTEAERTKK